MATSFCYWILRRPSPAQGLFNPPSAGVLAAAGSGVERPRAPGLQSNPSERKRDSNFDSVLGSGSCAEAVHEFDPPSPGGTRAGDPRLPLFCCSGLGVLDRAHVADFCVP